MVGRLKVVGVLLFWFVGFFPGLFVCFLVPPPPPLNQLRFFRMRINLAFYCPFLFSKLNLQSLGTWSKTHQSQMGIVPSNSVALDHALEAHIQDIFIYIYTHTDA